MSSLDKCFDWSVECLIACVRYCSKLEDISVARVKYAAAFAARVSSEAVILSCFSMLLLLWKLPVSLSSIAVPPQFVAFHASVC